MTETPQKFTDLKMKLEMPPFGAKGESPFAHDKLNRKDEIERLTPMIKDVDTPTVMALDAPWGAGKTAFVKMWAAHLNDNKEQEIPSMYFNAWETDFAVDPLVPFMETIKKRLPGVLEYGLMEKARELVPLVVHDIVGRAAGDTLAGIAKEGAEKMTHHDKMSAFKGAIESFAKSGKAKRIVIFVDELDRCRPDYAVKTLERIKHLFGVPGVIFVLAVNRKQLRDSVSALYGVEKKDADIYLRRFIEFDFTMQEPGAGEYIKLHAKRLRVTQHLIEKDITDKETPAACKSFLERIEWLAGLYDYSLRDIEQLLMRITLVLRSLGREERLSYPVLLAPLLVARQQMPGAYREYIQLEKNAKALVDAKALVSEWEKKLEPHYGGKEPRFGGKTYHYDAAEITAHIIMAKYLAQGGDDLNLSPDFVSIRDEYAGKAQTGTEEEKSYNRNVAEFLKQLGVVKSEVDLSTLIKKIELWDKFQFSDSDSSQ